jgi:hypothetical protein
MLVVMTCRCDVMGVTYATGADVTAMSKTMVVAIAGGSWLIGSFGHYITKHE